MRALIAQLSREQLEALAVAYLKQVGGSYFRPDELQRIYGTVVGKNNRPEGLPKTIPKELKFRCASELVAHLFDLKFDTSALWAHGTCYKCKTVGDVYHEDGFNQDGLCATCLKK